MSSECSYLFKIHQKIFYAYEEILDTESLCSIWRGLFLFLSIYNVEDMRNLVFFYFILLCCWIILAQYLLLLSASVFVRSSKSNFIKSARMLCFIPDSRLL